MAKLVNDKALGDIKYLNAITKFGEYIGTVTVLKQKFSCYPESFNKVDDAYEAAAKEAYSYLEPKHRGQLPETKDPNLITQRVIQIVGTEIQGYWSQSLVDKYAEDFKERLPSNWVSVVTEFAGDSIEFSPVADNYVMYPRAAQRTGELSTLQPPVKSENVDPALYIDQFEPIMASLSDSDVFFVHILVVHAADRVSNGFL